MPNIRKLGITLDKFLEAVFDSVPGNFRDWSEPLQDFSESLLDLANEAEKERSDFPMGDWTGEFLGKLDIMFSQYKTLLPEDCISFQRLQQLERHFHTEELEHKSNPELNVNV